jgi:hypothetical protein
MAKTMNHAAIGASIASSLIAMKGAMEKAQSHKDEANVLIVNLHSEGIAIGRKGQCAIATAFVDGLVSGGIAKGTAANYLSVLRDHVKSGKPVEDWNPSRAKGKGKGKGKGAKGTKEFHVLLAAVFNHGEGETLKGLCEDWETTLSADKGIHALIGDYLASEGYEINAE